MVAVKIVGLLGLLFGDAVGLVSRVARRHEHEQLGNSRKCLKFMQIPRTGGTTTESLNLHLPHGSRSYESLMVDAMDKAANFASLGNFTLADGSRPKGRSAGELFDEAHGSELQDEASWAASIVYGTQWLHKLPFRWVPQNHTCEGGNCVCQDLHTPPHLDREVASYFGDGCDVFCTVRDPLDRALSAYKFVFIQGPCTADGFSHFVEQRFPLKKDPTNVCHYVPQTQFVYGADSKSASTRQYCNRVMRFENLSADYNELMAEFGSPLRFSKKSEKKALFKTEHCHIDKSKISRKAKDMIYEYYQADYEAFGYPKP